MPTNIRTSRLRRVADSRALSFLIGPGMVIAMGVAVVATLFAYHGLIRTQLESHDMSDELMLAQVETSLFHFMFEEYISGDVQMMRRNPWDALDRADAGLERLLHGGRRTGRWRKPVSNPELRSQAENLRAALVAVRVAAVALEKEALTQGFGHDLDQGFDKTIRFFLVEAANLERDLSRLIGGGRARIEMAFSGILVGWISVLGFAMLGLVRYENRRRSAEEAVMLAKQDWERTFDSVPDLISIIDENHTIKRVNRAMAERLGISEAAAVGRPCFELVHGGEAPHTNCPHNRLLQDGITHTAEIYEERLGGHFAISVSPLRDAAGALTGSIHVAHEITERKEAEEKLRRAHDEMEERVEKRTADLRRVNEELESNIGELNRSQTRLEESQNRYRSLSHEFHALLDAMNDAILLMAPNLKVIWANQWANRELVRDAGDLRGWLCHELIHQETRPCDDCPVRACFGNGRPHTVRKKHSDGRLFELRTFPIANEGGETINVILVASDITEKTSLEQEAIRSAHLASLGELAAGVAHEINNPVNGIINYAQIVVNREGEGSAAAELASRIIREGDRVADIVSNLLSFARDRQENRRPSAVRAILDDALALVGSQLRKSGVLLEFDLPGDLPEVLVTPQQIQQIFLNLLSNAQYALNKRYPGPHDEKTLRIHGSVLEVGGAPFLRVTFRDGGAGIAPGNLDRVMDPFMTTKPLGRGTGLGLSISHHIVKEHGGRLTIESREGEYTEVRVDLPCAGPC